MADINQIIDPKAIKQLEKLNRELIKSGESIDKLIPDFERMAQSTSKIGKSNEDASKKRQKLTKAQEESLKKEKELEKASEKLDKQRQRGLAQMAKIEAKERELRNEINKQVRSIEDARKQNIALRKVRSQLDITTEKGRKKLEEYNQTIDKNNEFIKENSDSLTKQKINVGNYEESIQKALEGTELFNGGIQGAISKLASLSQQEGGVKGFFGSVVGGLKQATKAAISFIATPIGAVIAAVVAGIAVFTGAINRNQRASDTFGKIWEGITNVISEVTGRIFQLVGAVGELFKGNFGAFKDEAIGAFTGFGDAMKYAFEEGQNLRQLQIDLERDTINATTAITELTGKIREQQIIADDATRSFAEREAASERARILERDLAEQNLALRTQELEIVNKQVQQAERQGKLNRELEQQQADALAAQIEADNELTAVMLENEKTRSELQQDRLERDLDILIDGFDNIKMINERIIASDDETFRNRQDLLLKTAELGTKSFDKQIKTIQKFTDVQFNANELLEEQDAERLNSKIRELELSEIIEGRLLEIIRERTTAVQDLTDAQKNLTDELLDIDIQPPAEDDVLEMMKKESEEAAELNEQQTEERIRLANEEADAVSEAERRKQKVREEIQQKGIELAGFLFDFRIQKLRAELEAAEGNERKQAEIKQRLAQAEKRKALFEVAVNTASAVTEALPNVALSILAGAIGLVQAATIAAQPIPQFAKGTDYSPEGLAMVGEKGRELIQTPKGEVFLANNPALVNLERGSRVITNKRTEAYLNDGNIVSELRQTRKAIQRMPQPVFQNGSKIAERRGNYWKHYRNNKHRLN
jgi:hypothetical protein